MKTNQIVVLVSMTLALLFGCTRETLSSHSVIETYSQGRPTTDLDRWIQERFSPYNIEVVYRWDKSSLPAGTLAYPPKPEKVSAVLQVVDELLFKTYSNERAGGAFFMKDKGLIRIVLLGGHEVMNNKVLLKLWNGRAATNELFIYGVNDFDPKDPKKVDLLLRSVHHQFAKRLTEQIPYDKDAFFMIGKNTYGSMGLTYSESRLFERVGLSPYAHRKGFYTLHSMTLPEDDFAEIITTLLLHSAVEIKDAEDKAAIAFDPTSPKSVKEAEEAHRILVAKREFVEQYFKEKVKINIRRLQLISLENRATHHQKQEKSKE